MECSIMTQSKYLCTLQMELYIEVWILICNAFIKSIFCVGIVFVEMQNILYGNIRQILILI